MGITTRGLPSKTQLVSRLSLLFALKGQNIVAQGQRSGEAAERHPGVTSRFSPTLKGLHRTTLRLVVPFQGTGAIHPQTQGGAATPLTLGYYVVPLRGGI